MIDLTEAFREAKAKQAGWDMQKFRTLLSQINGLPGGLRIDWDEGAGEDWASALAKEGVAAILRVDEPLVIVIGEDHKDIGYLASQNGAVVIYAQTWDGEDYCLDHSVVTEIFPDWWWGGLENIGELDKFSIWHLWWLTI